MDATPSESNVVSSGYDAMYAAMPGSLTLLRIWKERAAGADYGVSE